MKEQNPKATIYYRDIGDYHSREDKLRIIREAKSFIRMKDKLTILHPNKYGDWIAHRDEGFEELIPLAPEKKFDAKTQSVFTTVAIGISTNRDAWVYNYSREAMFRNMRETIAYYNSGCRDMNPTKISWTHGLQNDAKKNVAYAFTSKTARTALYRPFCMQHLYGIKDFIERPGISAKLFPTSKHENQMICLTGNTGSFSCLMVSQIASLDMLGGTQCFPLYWYEKNENVQQMGLFDAEPEYVRRDGISDFMLERTRELCGSKVTKEDIFYYVYGVLHSEEYRAKYAVNLKKGLPRLPLPGEPKLFWTFSKAGRALADLHLNYETLMPHKGVKEGSRKTKPSYRVEKMRFAKDGGGENKTAIIYNDDITVLDIPLDAYTYTVNGKSAIEWVMERYQVTTHKESGIVNDPNLWCDEHNNPRYILDLLKRIVTLSLETLKITQSLPKLV